MTSLNTLHCQPLLQRTGTLSSALHLSNSTCCETWNICEANGISRADEMFEASSLTANSIQKAPYTSEAKNSAFNLRFGTSPYTWYAENPERGARFASAMAGYVQSTLFQTHITFGEYYF
jgi:hypothetical protein